MIRAAPFLFAWLAAVGTVAGASEIDPADLEFFESKIRPVLAERCYQCHGGDPAKIRGGLILLDAEGVRAGGDSGAVIVPGSPEDSLMIEALHYEGLTQMPPDGKLPAHVIADFEQWIRRGAPDPRTGGEQTVVATRAAETFDYGPGREHWAFRRVEDPALPEVEDEAWVSHDLDRFILSRLEERGLAPVAPADRRTLLRRATFDLIGLAPSEAEIEDFLADESPDAFARVVDRLLASPHYGERWGRHWLDIARYADSNGLDENIAFPNAFRYRDYVVDSLNRDKPFNRFVREQIAGDLMPAETDAQRFEQITATGFLMLGPKVLAEQDVDKMLIDIVDEQVNTLGRAFLALPVGCARCHDHKFDPIPTADYYAMAGILRSTETMSDAAGMRWLERPLAPEDKIAEYEAAQKLVAEAQEKVDEVVREQNDVLRGPRRAALADYLLAAEEAYPSWSADEAVQEEAKQALARIAGDRGSGTGRSGTMGQGLPPIPGGPAGRGGRPEPEHRLRHLERVRGRLARSLRAGDRGPAGDHRLGESADGAPDPEPRPRAGAEDAGGSRLAVREPVRDGRDRLGRAPHATGAQGRGRTPAIGLQAAARAGRVAMAGLRRLLLHPLPRPGRGGEALPAGRAGAARQAARRSRTPGESVTPRAAPRHGRGRDRDGRSARCTSAAAT